MSTDLIDVTVFGTLTTIGLAFLPLRGLLHNKSSLPPDACHYHYLSTEADLALGRHAFIVKARRGRHNA